MTVLRGTLHHVELQVLDLDPHPWAGGDDHYAAFLEDAARSKLELVAED